MKPARLIAAALFGVAAIVASAGLSPVEAHEEVPGVSSVIDSITPALPAGVTVQARISVADQLIVENTTDVALVVIGEAEEPFLRIGPDGVFANVKSPTWYRSNDPTGAAKPPDDVAANPRAEPVWARVTAETSYGWFDHRLHRGRLTRPPAVQDRDKPVVLEEWSVPMRYGEAPVTVKGHREYKFPSGTWTARVIGSPPDLNVHAIGGLIPALTVFRANDADRRAPIVILGEQGEPMIRLTADGAEVNEASPTWVFTAEAKGGFVRSGLVGAAEPPRWVRQPSPQVTWLDRRGQMASGAFEGHEGDKLVWRVPATVGGRRVEIVAETRWTTAEPPPSSRPGDDGDDRPWWQGWALWAVGGLVILGVVGGRMWLTRPSTSMGDQPR